MSKNRRRNRRRSRGQVRHQGAGVPQSITVKSDRNPCGTDEWLPAGSQAMFRDGQGTRLPPKEPKGLAWATHDCDTDATRYRKRNAGRDVSRAWGAYFLEMREYTDAQFMAGKGLTRDGRFVLYVQGRQRGRTDDGNKALAFKRAANEAGFDATMWDSRQGQVPPTRRTA